MKAIDVRTGAQLEIGVQITTLAGLQYINEAIRDVCLRYPKAGKIGSSTIISTDSDTFYDIDTSSSILQIKDVFSVKGSEEYLLRNNGYCYEVTSDDKIRFFELGTYKVEFYKQYDSLTNEESNVPLPHQFHDCLKFFVAAKVRGRLMGMRDGNTIALRSEYEMKVASSNNSFSKKGGRKRMPPSYK